MRKARKMIGSNIAGFELLYKSYTERQAIPRLYDIELIRKTAELMYSMGVLDGSGVFCNVKTTRGVIRRVTETRNKIVEQIEESEEKTKVLPIQPTAPLSPDDLIGRVVTIKVKSKSL